jgi:hypothetical protein
MTQVLGHRVDRVIVKLWVRSAHVFDHKEGLKAWRPILFNCSTSIFFIKSMLTYNYAKLMLTMPILAAQPRSACLSTNRSKGQARQPAAAS